MNWLMNTSYLVIIFQRYDIWVEWKYMVNISWKKSKCSEICIFVLSMKRFYINMIQSAFKEYTIKFDSRRALIRHFCWNILVKMYASDQLIHHVVNFIILGVLIIRHSNHVKLWVVIKIKIQLYVFEALFWIKLHQGRSKPCC